MFSLADLAEVQTDLISIRNTIGQVDDSETLNDDTGENLVIYETFSFNVRSSDLTYDPDVDTVLSGTFDRVIFDRHTGAVYDCDEAESELCDEKTGSVKVDEEATDTLGTLDDIAFVRPGEENFDGFRGQYFKMPFNTQKTDYVWWDGDLGNAADPAEVDEDSWLAKYEGEETIDGLNTYKFVQTIPDTKTGDARHPGRHCRCRRRGRHHRRRDVLQHPHAVDRARDRRSDQGHRAAAQLLRLRGRRGRHHD